jgi:uncharacterized protein (TIGR03067 family)
MIINKTMKTNLFLIGLAAATISLASAEDQAIKKDLALLQGEWSMVSGSADGQAMPAELAEKMKRICKGDETTVMMAEEVFFKAKITIDPSKQPKTIDYAMSEGLNKGKTLHGIYEVDGDTLKSCFGGPGAERPADFTNKTGDHRTLSVWKRAKPATPAPDQK